MKLRPQGLQTFDELQAFVEGSQAVEIEAVERADAYDFVARTLRHYRYHACSRAQRGVLRRYLAKVTGFSRAQLTRLIGQHQRCGEIRDRRGPPARPFLRRYTKQDIRLLAQVDADHEQLSGPATRKLCERAHKIFGEAGFERLAGISNGQLYNLRHSTTYRRSRTHIQKTQPQHVAIGERRKPRPEGRPGFLRVDSVHQGDEDGRKGVYHINLVDEVTQYQFIGSVEVISERCLVPLLEGLIEAFPFEILGFHADNGSEYINHRVQQLLSKLHIEEFTKSRARRSHDNALVESKNGAVLRKHLGYAHIPAEFAGQLNEFNQTVLSPYLNYHRPCFFPREKVDAKGRRRKEYRYEDMMTPYEKLRSLPGAASYLRAGITFEELDEVAYGISDTEAARRKQQARRQLFRSINNAKRPAA